MNKEPDKCFVKNKTPYTSVKTSLKSIIKDNDIITNINELVIKCNHIVIDAYMFIRLFALNQYHNNLPIPELNEDFISYCIMSIGTRDARGKSAKNKDLLITLNSFYTSEFQPIFNHQKHDLRGLSFTIPYICQTMETCITTNLKEHFIKRLMRFINISAMLYYDTHYCNLNTNILEKKQLIWKLKKAILDNKYDKIPIEFQNWFELHHHSIIPTEFTKSIPYDCHVSPFKYIKYSFYMNSKFEEYNDTIKRKILHSTDNKEIKELNSQLIKLFQPLSLRNNCIPKYITIDTASLINLFAEKGQKGKLLQTLKESQKLVWYDYFRMDKKIFNPTNGYIFNYTIQTDGIGCSLLFKHESLKDKRFGSKIKSVLTNDTSIPYIDELTDSQIEIMKTKKMVCGDPGKKFLLYMMDNYGNELKYSCMQRDTESLAKRNRRIMKTNKENSNTIQNETILSNYCSKTINYNKFKDFIKVKHETNIETKQFYEAPVFRKLNWRTKTYRQKSEDKFLNNITTTFGNKEDIVICIGDWSNKNTIKGLASTMGIGLKRLIHKKFTTLQIDEYNTSKKCCNCWKDIENISINGNKKFRLLGCKNCTRCNIGSPEDEPKSIFQSYSFMTRDKNSCINMLSVAKHILYNKKRPIEFSRGKSALADDFI